MWTGPQKDPGGRVRTLNALKGVGAARLGRRWGRVALRASRVLRTATGFVIVYSQRILTLDALLWLYRTGDVMRPCMQVTFQETQHSLTGVSDYAALQACQNALCQNP